jgi:O-antigen ligase
MDVPAYLRRLAIPTIALAGLALVATLSRGGWVELLLSVAILTGATWLRNGISVKNALVAAVVTGVVGICLYVPNPVSSRIFADDNGAAHSRLPLMHLAYRIISANPVLGVGANNFAVVMNDYASSEFRHEWIYTVHNEFLLVLSETGVLGLLAFLWIYLDIIRRAWRLWKSRDGVFSPLGLGIVAAIGGYLSHMFVDIFSERGLLQLIWMFVAVVAACEIIWQRERAEQLSRSTTEVTVR